MMTGHRRILAWLPLLLAVLFAPLKAADFVGIPDHEFARHYRAQHASEWCWASCVEMALSYEGVRLPQESIVARSFGSGVNLGGLPEDIVASTSGLFRTESGIEARISGSLVAGAPPPVLLCDQLQRRQPVIMLYKRSDGSGHAVVLTGVEVEQRQSGRIRIAALHVFDPSVGWEGQEEEADEGAAARASSPEHNVRIFRAVSVGGRVATVSGPIDGVVLVDSTPVSPAGDDPAPAGSPALYGTR
jgi:hypothetical protein